MEFILANDYRCMIILYSCCSRLDNKLLKILRLTFDVETFIEDLSIQIVERVRLILHLSVFMV